MRRWYWGLCDIASLVAQGTGLSEGVPSNPELLGLGRALAEVAFGSCEIAEQHGRIVKLTGDRESVSPVCGASEMAAIATSIRL
jgi:hypothetical protein